MLDHSLLKLYLNLSGWVIAGVVLDRCLPPKTANGLGQFLFWIGVPLSIVAFLRHSHLNDALWLAPIVAWIAILLGAGLSFLFLQKQWSRATQGSFLLATMLGNTGYLGYPIALSLIGPQYFAWTLFYDILGTLIGSYSLGIAIAARCSTLPQSNGWLAEAMLKNPALWSFGFGLLIKDIPLPQWLDVTLEGSGWAMVNLSLILIGMRLNQLSSWRSLHRASLSVSIKMIGMPLLLGAGLSILGLTSLPKLAIVLQIGMPPAFATLILAEAYQLDRELTVTAVALGSVVLLFTLPIWVTLFGTP